MKKIIGIFGYGSQGRAHALNLRDSGNKVLIANIEDKYLKRAKKDNFKIYTFKYVAQKADIIFLLLPDHLHKTVYKDVLEKYLKTGSSIIVAHGYSLYFKELKISKNFNWFYLHQDYLGHLKEIFISKKKNPSILFRYIS